MNLVNITEIRVFNDSTLLDVTFPEELLWRVRPLWEIIIKIVMMIPIILIGTIGNLNIIFAIICNKKLRTTTNLLILNMAVADFAMIVCCSGIFVSVDIYQPYVLGEIGCKFDAFVLQALTLVTVFSLIAVSYDRLSAIVLDCPGKLTVRCTRILILVTWITALSVASPLAFFRVYSVRHWKNYTERFCAEKSSTIVPYWNVAVGLSVWTPVAVMAVCYSMLYFKLDRYEAKALKSRHPMIVSYKEKVARVMFLAILVFIICRVPFTILVIKRAQMRNSDDIKVGQASSFYILWYVGRYFVFLNAAINPLLYGCTSRALRQTLLSFPPVSWLISNTTTQKRTPPKSYNLTMGAETTLDCSKNPFSLIV